MSDGEQQHSPPDHSNAELSLGAIPLFPLPNVVLLPSAILPLHIFEERYKSMIQDALDGAAELSRPKHIAMALLKPGWEKRYYNQPEIESVVCVGRIITHERLDDGKYNILLHGTTRARIVRELCPSADGGKTYRVAELSPLPESGAMEIDLLPQRDRLKELFGATAIARTPFGAQVLKLIAGPMTTAELADVIAFNLFEDAGFKQSLLAEGDVQRRVGKTLAALERFAPLLRKTVSDQCCNN